MRRAKHPPDNDRAINGCKGRRLFGQIKLYLARRLSADRHRAQSGVRFLLDIALNLRGPRREHVGFRFCEECVETTEFIDRAERFGGNAQTEGPIQRF